MTTEVTTEVKEEVTTEDAFYSKDEKDVETKEEVNSEVVAEVSEEEVADQGEKTEEKALEESTEEQEIEYKLALQKETYLDNSNVDSITEFAKEHNLSNDTAQAILNKQDETIANFIQAEDDKQEAELKEWRDLVVNDEKLGGSNLNKTVENARRVVERYGDDQFIEVLKETGYGDHPAVVKFLSNLGGLMADDSLVLPNAQEANPKQDWEYFYKQ